MCDMAPESSLTGDEQPVLLLHPHWKTLIGPVLVAVIVLAVALLVEAADPVRRAARRPGGWRWPWSRSWP